jgi:hypothetical protein
MPGPHLLVVSGVHLPWLNDATTMAGNKTIVFGPGIAAELRRDWCELAKPQGATPSRHPSWAT